MAVFHSAEALAVRARQIGKELQTVPAKNVPLAAQMVSHRIEAAASGLRIPRSHPRKLSARVQLMGREAARITPGQAGIWTWVEEGTGGHLITSKHGAGGRRTRVARWAGSESLGGDRRAVLNIPGIGYRRWAHHPGTGPIRPGTYERGATVGVTMARHLFDVDVKAALRG